MAWLTYDDHFFYAAFEFSDPNPKEIRAPYGDHDDTPSYTDYGGIILDTRNDGKTGIEFFANPRGIQYDAVNSDASGEDNSLDLYWDSAARIGPDGWRLEIRVPFSSLRYNKGDPQTWGILLYRNYPRAFRYQMFNVKLPRNRAASSATSRRSSASPGCLPATTSSSPPMGPAGSIRRRWAIPARGSRAARNGTAASTPNGIPTPSRRSTPRSIRTSRRSSPTSPRSPATSASPSSSPRSGLSSSKGSTCSRRRSRRSTPATSRRRAGACARRASSKASATRPSSPTTEAAGSVILPGPQTSGLANQDFASHVVIGRARRDFGSSYGSFLLTDKEVDGGGHNRVFGPDSSGGPRTPTSSAASSSTATHRRRTAPTSPPRWDGRRLESHAAFGLWSHSSKTWDWLIQVEDIGDDFRADLGFLPQVGIRDTNGDRGLDGPPGERPGQPHPALLPPPQPRGHGRQRGGAAAHRPEESISRAP